VAVAAEGRRHKETALPIALSSRLALMALRFDPLFSPMRKVWLVLFLAGAL